MVTKVCTRGHAPKLANMGNAAILQDDNVRPHPARAVTHFYLHHSITHLESPANSLDSSPIEHLWDELERRLRPRLRPDSTLSRCGAFPAAGVGCYTSGKYNRH